MIKAVSPIIFLSLLMLSVFTACDATLLNLGTPCEVNEDCTDGYICTDGHCVSLPSNDGDINPDGDMLDGDVPDGDAADGDLSDGDAIPTDGDLPDGDAGDGDLIDGDLLDGDMEDYDADCEEFLIDRPCGTADRPVEGRHCDGRILLEFANENLDGEPCQGPGSCCFGVRCRDSIVRTCNGPCEDSDDGTWAECLMADGDVEVDYEDGDLDLSETDLCFNVDCDQGNNPCTRYECDSSDGLCYPQFHPNGTCQQDNNPCTRHECNSSDHLCHPQFRTNGTCQQDNNPCTRHHCSADSMNCVDYYDDSLSCNDHDPCNGTEACQSGQCLHQNPIACKVCEFCDSFTGQCICSDEPCAAPELCNGEDDNCDGHTDEDDACEDPDIGIRVELRWQNGLSDMDLHFLRPGGVFGGQFLDYDDCTKNNTHPDWGIEDLESDDPEYGDDIQNGSVFNWQEMEPETVHLPLPGQEPYRVLVHYSKQNLWPNNGRVQIKVFLDGSLSGEYEVDLQRAQSFWNVVCIDYHQGLLNPITSGDGESQISYDDLEDIDAQACNGPGSYCSHACDCQQGLGCVENTCISGVAAVYCCTNPDCPTGESCIFENDYSGYCGGMVTFDRGPSSSQQLPNAVEVEKLYSPWGIRFSTPNGDSVAATDTSWELDSYSEGNCCSSLKTDNSRWTHPLTITFVEPTSAGSETYQVAATYYAGFFAGETHVNYGLRVRAYNIGGIDESNLNVNKIADLYIASSRWTEIIPEVPMHQIRIEQVNDPDFVIDDVLFGPIFTL